MGRITPIDIQLRQVERVARAHLKRFQQASDDGLVVDMQQHCIAEDRIAIIIDCKTKVIGAIPEMVGFGGK